jgi:hypothetical protein
MAKRKGNREISRKTPQAGKTPNPALPDPESVVSEREFISPKGRRYRILRTTDKDPYDPPDDPAENQQGKKDK